MVWRVIQSMGLVVVLIAAIGALGTKFGVWFYTFGFQMLLIALFLGFLGLVASLIGIGVSLKRKTHELLIGLAISGCLCGGTFAYIGFHYWKIGEYPPIHDVSTDLDDVPTFELVVEARGESSNPLEFKPDSARWQREHYADLESWETPWTLASTVVHVQETLDDLGMEIIGQRPSEEDLAESSISEAHVEATATTFWFGFKDDFVVRARSDGARTGRTVVDVRSVSRIGVGDLGANAQRIRKFLAELQARAE